MKKNSKIYIAWHKWLVGSALLRKLKEDWYTNLVFKTSWELDLSDNKQVENFFRLEKPEYVFLAAAKVWGILANKEFPADFLYKNLQIENNVIHNSYLSWVKKLLFLWSSCIYPKMCSQPIKEEYLLTWSLEETNEPYAIAKITWIKLCQSYNRQYNTNFIACMPTNLYGPNDNFDLNSSHVLPAMIRKFHEAKINNWDVTLWWDWTPMREFLYVDDMAKACIYLINNFSPTKLQNEDWDIFVNIWTWKDLTIKELAQTIQKIVWFDWKVVWDISKPNWTPRKLLDVSKLEKLWYKYNIELEDGIRKSYEWYLRNK